MDLDSSVGMAGFEGVGVFSAGTGRRREFGGAEREIVRIFEGVGLRRV